MSTEIFRKLFPSEYYRRFLDHGIRPDDRTTLTFRKASISTGTITSAYGSSFVSVGNTSIMCGIRAEVGLLPAPNDKSNELDKKRIAVNLEMPPLCSPFIRSGKPIELSQTIGQSLNTMMNQVLDCENLTGDQTTGVGSSDSRPSWFIFADLYCFNHDGNIQDAAQLALIAALKSTKLPLIQVTPQGEAVVSSDPSERPIQLKFNHFPISSTFSVFEDRVLADPNMEEEGIQTGSLSIVLDQNSRLIHVIQHGKVSDDLFQKCVTTATDRTQSMIQLLNKIK